MERRALNNEQYSDMCLTCIGCGKNFDFPATEQDYFARHSLDSPKRCRDCRAKKQKKNEIPVQREENRRVYKSSANGPTLYVENNDLEKTKAEKGSEFLLILLLNEVKELRRENSELLLETKTIKTELNRIYNLLYDMDYEDEDEK